MAESDITRHPIHVARNNKIGETLIAGTVVASYSYRNFLHRHLMPRDPRLALLALERYVERVMEARRSATEEPIFVQVVDHKGNRLHLLTYIVANWRDNYTGRTYVRNPCVVAELRRWAAFHLEMEPKTR